MLIYILFRDNSKMLGGFPPCAILRALLITLADPKLSTVGAPECDVIFSKIVSFKSMIIKCLNMVAAHIEGLRHPLIYLFNTLFSCQCPFKRLCSHNLG
jgi:hypothetical protein